MRGTANCDQDNTELVGARTKKSGKYFAFIKQLELELKQ